MMNRFGMLATILATSDLAVREPAQSSSVCNITLDDLADLDMGSLDVMGDVGARRRRKRAKRGGTNLRMLVPAIPGQPAIGVRLQPLGFGATAFTLTSGTILALTARPQRPFRGQRLIVDVARTGTTATGLVTLTRVDVGTQNQLVSSGALSVTAFAATAFDANIQIDPATPGIDMTLQFAITAAPTTTDRVDISATIFGTTVG
jgi:hypothetical protein